MVVVWTPIKTCHLSVSHFFVLGSLYITFLEFFISFVGHVFIPYQYHNPITRQLVMRNLFALTKKKNVSFVSLMI